MNIELTHEQLDYLVIMVEKDLQNDELYYLKEKLDMNMLHNLYSKLVVLQGSNELKTK